VHERAYPQFPTHMAPFSSKKHPKNLHSTCHIESLDACMEH
jgi:hypothetical protein